MTTPQAPPKGSAPAPVLAPFRAGTQPTYKPSGYQQQNNLGAVSVPLPDYQIGPTNLLRGIDIEITATTSANAAAVAFNPDMPLGALSTVNFQDSGGNSIVGSFDSYTIAMIMKYGVYAQAQLGDPRNSAVYSTVTGAVATGGSFNFVLRIPVEFIARTGAGSLVNQTTQSPLTLSLTMTTSALMYATAPTNAVSVLVQVDLLGYWKGSNAAANPAPKVAGTTQYWNRSSIQALNGASDFYAPQIGIGNPIRTFLWLNYATGGARSSAAFPSPLTVNYKGNLLFNMTKNQWQSNMSRWFGLLTPFTTTAGVLAAVTDTGPGLDTGVFAFPFATDFDKDTGAELMLSYLNTEVGDAIEFIGSWNASSTLFHVVNYLGVNGVLQPGLI
jgi:hypothetical protein